MAKLLTDVVAPHVLPLLEPHEAGLPSLKQVQALEAEGFSPVYDRTVLARLELFGAVIARTRVDGALWPYARAAGADGLARWARFQDVLFLSALGKAIVERGPEREDLYDLLLKRRERNGLPFGLDETTRLALDTIRMMGKSDAVWKYLENLE